MRKKDGRNKTNKKDKWELNLMKHPKLLSFENRSLLLLHSFLHCIISNSKIILGYFHIFLILRFSKKNYFPGFRIFRGSGNPGEIKKIMLNTNINTLFLVYDHSNIKILTENKKSTKYASSLIKIHTIYNLTAIQKDTKQL